LQPRNFPFYYPNEHKTIIDLLEDKQPNAIIAIAELKVRERIEEFVPLQYKLIGANKNSYFNN
jgi:hypothetical protein